MTVRSVIDVRALTAHASRTDAPLWWGMLAAMVIEVAVFSVLIAAYFALRVPRDPWLSQETAPSRLVLPALSMMVLGAGGLAMHSASLGIQMGDQSRLRRGLLHTIALAALFLALKYVEYAEVPFRWDANAYASILWILVGLQSAHVLVLLGLTIVLSVLASRGFFSPQRRLGVIINTMCWYSAAAISFVLYLVLQLSPRLS